MNQLMLSISGADERLLRAFIVRRRSLGTTAMRRITKVGNPVVIVPLTLTLAFHPNPLLSDVGAVAAFSLAFSHLVVHLLKRRVSRPRPRLPVAMGWLIEPEDRFSFPSGHAAAGLSVGLPLFMASSGPVGAVCLVLGLMVGVSRCYLGVHYPFDVLAGWVLAGLTVFGFSLIF
ncbi:MAG: phosphatase PAP2 family protein [Gemmatimonadota bacterium]